MSDIGSKTLQSQMEERARRVSDYAGSEMFIRSFKEGMDLVEETASYLDGPGREESRQLSRSGSLTYARESMRLTTRLMQVASWLLVQRAVREGDMSAEQASNDKYRLAGEKAAQMREEDSREIPARLHDLMARSRAIYDRAQRVDQGLYTKIEAPNPVSSQVDLLKDAFERR